MSERRLFGTPVSIETKKTVSKTRDLSRVLQNMKENARNRGQKNRETIKAQNEARSRRSGKRR